jgi:hypothetical protein
MANNSVKEYKESIMYQMDLLPNATQSMTYKCTKDCHVEHVTYYLDDSMNSNVSVFITYTDRNGNGFPLVTYPQNGNNHVTGTNNNTVLEINTDTDLNYGDSIIVNAVSTSSNDVTIMCIVNINYTDEVKL